MCIMVLFVLRIFVNYIICRYLHILWHFSLAVFYILPLLGVKNGELVLFGLIKRERKWLYCVPKSKFTLKYYRSIRGWNVTGEQQGREIQCIRLIGNYTRFFIGASAVNGATLASARVRERDINRYLHTHTHTHTRAHGVRLTEREWLEEKTTRSCRHLSLSHRDGSKMYFFLPPLVREHFLQPSRAHYARPPSVS